MKRKYALFYTAALLASTSIAQGETADLVSYQKALQQAQNAEAKDGRFYCQGTVTNDTLKQAKTDADAEHYAKAIALAKKAKVLADLSIAQYYEQLKLWHNEVVR
jgi:phage-related protein